MYASAFFILTAMVTLGVQNRNREFKNAPAQIDGCADPSWKEHYIRVHTKDTIQVSEPVYNYMKKLRYR